MSFAVNGLARMGFWAAAEPSAAERAALLSALLVSVPAMGRRQVANTWWSLGRMGLALDVSALGLLSAQGLGQGQGQGQGAGLGSEPGQGQGAVGPEPAAVPAAVPVPVGTGEQTTPSPSLLALTTAALVAALARSVEAMPPSEFAWSLWAVARCGVCFDSLPPPLARLLVATACRLVPAMGTGELGVSLWALGRMKAPVAALPPQLIDLLFAGIEGLALRAAKRQGGARGRQ